MPFVDASGISTVSSTALARGLLLVLSSGISPCVSAPLASGSMIHAGSGISECLATPLGWLTIPVEVTLAVATTSIKVRITFDRGMLDDAKLVNLAFYTITPKFYTGVPVTVISATPQGIAEPTYVDLVITEMTDGETYIAEVRALNGPTDPEGTPLGPAANSVEFLGIGIDPTIDSVTATGLNEVEVKFSEGMYDNAVIHDSARYTFDNGLSVLSVKSLNNDIVTLITDNQIPGILYTLTITQP